MCGKGDGNIRYYEFNQGTLFNHGNDFKSTVPGKVNLLLKYFLIFFKGIWNPT